MFLPQNPSTSPPADPPSTAVSRDSNVMVTCGPKDRPGYTFTGEAFRKILTNPDLNKMADQVEPTIGPLINEKQLKQLMEDVRGSDDGNCFLSMGGGEDSQDLSFGVQSDMRGYGPQYHCSNYSEASTSGPSTPPPGLTSSYMPIHARLPTIPSTTEYPGNWNFQISFGPLTESASKSATWTYSDVCKKLYVNLASFCPIKFKTNSPPPPGTYLRAVAVFKGSTNLHDIVKRCPNHMESSNDGSAPNNHFIRSNNPAARYHTCPESSRHSVLLPYNGPQVGTEYVTEMFAFMCFSSCASGPSRRPVEVIFTLEQNGQTLGRRVVEIRVCACPGRDRKSDEKVACGEPSSSQGVRRTRKGSGNKGPSSKRRRTSSRSQDEEFIITTKNRHVYDILLEMKDSLEGKFESLNIQSPEHSLVLSTSEDEADQPSTSGSPGAVFKRVGLSSM
ncbi:cellular tumor antigen p53-like isoform X4 [Orbicella faveolata]|uniref:cellular tumor antigen p53-like isoform X4 n=1 Tax=Orbicella faveolata TaxID=48498 RepID=UPI0009E43D68|nr:cellular tumor antigen p53-like isoform X4 [Orbicella faveolata]